MPSIRDALWGVRKRALDRVRGEPNLEWLVAQGMELGVETDISQPIYIDRLHPWLIKIDDYVTLGPYVAIITHDATMAHHIGQTRLGRVVVGKRAMVGVGAILLPGTTIGEDSVVGAGAVVHGDIPPGSMVVGNPAKAAPIKAAVAWHRVAASRSPSWPHEGWTIDTGIDQARKREQKEALANCASGYVPAGPAPGSPYARQQQPASRSS